MSHILSFLGSKDTRGYRSCARAVGHIAALNFFQTPVAILRIGREKTGPQTAPRLQEKPFSHSPALMQCGAAVTMTKDRACLATFLLGGDTAVDRTAVPTRGPRRLGAHVPHSAHTRSHVERARR